MTTKGKRLSPAQRRVLELMAPEGATLERWHGITATAFVRRIGRLTTSVSDIPAFKLSRTDLLEVVDDDWRRTIYKLTDAGRAALGPAAPAVTDEPGQGSGSEGVAAGRAGDQVIS